MALLQRVQGLAERGYDASEVRHVAVVVEDRASEETLASIAASSSASEQRTATDTVTRAHVEHEFDGQRSVGSVPHGPDTTPISASR